MSTFSQLFYKLDSILEKMKDVTDGSKAYATEDEFEDLERQFNLIQSGLSKAEAVVDDIKYKLSELNTYVECEVQDAVDAFEVYDPEPEIDEFDGMSVELSSEQYE